MGRAILLKACECQSESWCQPPQHYQLNPSLVDRQTIQLSRLAHPQPSCAHVWCREKTCHGLGPIEMSLVRWLKFYLETIGLECMQACTWLLCDTMEKAILQDLLMKKCLHCSKFMSPPTTSWQGPAARPSLLF